MKSATVQIYFWLVLASLIACKSSNRISKTNSHENELEHAVEEDNGLFNSSIANNTTYANEITAANEDPGCNQNNFPLIATEPWLSIGPSEQPSGNKGGVGQLTFIVKDPNNENLLLTGSEFTGLWYTENGGELWKNGGTDKLEPEIGVKCAAVSTALISTWYIGTMGQYTSSGIYKSTDKGQTWTFYYNFNTYSINYPTGGWYSIEKIIIDPNNANVMYVATTHGLYKTTNALSNSPTFTIMQTPGMLYSSFYDVEFKPGNSNVVYASGNQAFNLNSTLENAPLVVSFNAGSTWSNLPDVNTEPITSDKITGSAIKISIEVTPANADKLYIFYIKDPDLDSVPFTTSLPNYLLRARLLIYDASDLKYLDKGWITSGTGSYEQDFGINSSRFHNMCVSPTDANFVLAVDVYLARIISATASGTANFLGLGNSSSNIHDDIHGNLILNDGQTIYTVSDGGVFKSTNQGLTWEGKMSGITASNMIRFATSKTKKDVLAIGAFHTGPNKLLHNQWNRFMFGDGNAVAIDQTDANYIYGSIQRGSIIRSSNPIGISSLSISCPQKFDTDFILDSNNPNIMFSSKRLTSGNEELFRIENIKTALNDSDLVFDQISKFSIDTFGTFNITQSIIWKTYNSKNNPNYFVCHVLDNNVLQFNSDGSPQLDANGIQVKKTKHRLFYSKDINKPSLSLSQMQNSWEYLNFSNSSFSSDLVWLNDIYLDDTDENLFWFVVEPTYNSSKKIFFYNKTNNSFTELDRNLPSCVRVNCIVKQPGNNSLYIGTEKDGVWYLSDYTNASSTWKLPNSNLPHAAIVDLEIFECGNLLRAGIFGRGMWECPLVKQNPIFISAGLTEWSTPFFQNKDVVIENGATLKVSSNVNFSSDSKVIVKRGGQLIIDGVNAKLSNYCGLRWPGIQVWGNSNVPQNSANAAEFGKVILRNGGTIENAETGIITMKIDEQGNWDWNYSGGIMQCTNANFINNGRDVSFLNYANLNANGQEIITQSYFTKTNFITNDSYNYKEFAAPQWHVTIDHSTGIRFKGCNFKNLNTQTPVDYTGPDNKWGGGGIYAINSQVNVDQYCTGFNLNCTNPTPSIFENLREGISVKGTLKNRKLNCLHSEFINNATNGISIISQNYCSIISNNFSYVTPNPYEYATQSGLYQIGTLISLSTGYRVEENTYSGNSNGSWSQAGIKIVNSGAAPNEIYRNTFTNLYYGATALGTNKNTKINANGVGLQLLCLTHQNNRWDNAVTKKYNEPGIALYQGNLLGPNYRTADNTFSNITGTACTDVFNYYNECEFINYAGSSNLQYSPTLYDCNSIYVSNNIATNTGCPTKIGWHKKLSTVEKQSALNELNTKSTELQNAKALLSLITDGGNTNSVISTITQSQPAQTQQLVSNLMSLSPNVSLPVLLRVAHEDDKMSPT